MSDQLLSGARLHSLLGDRMHDLPRPFIDTLERILMANGVPHPAAGQRPALHVVPACTDHPDDAAPRASPAVTLPACAVPGLHEGTRQALDAILEILHAVHDSQHDGSNEVLLCERLVEGLIVAGRQLVREPAPSAR